MNNDGVSSPRVSKGCIDSASLYQRDTLREAALAHARATDTEHLFANMNGETEKLISMQTGPLHQAVKKADKLLGLEVLDLSVREPKPAPHFKVKSTKGASFLKKSADPHHKNAWQLSDQENSLTLELYLPQKHGVTLILEMCRTEHNEQDHTTDPVIISVNGDEWPLTLDAHHLKFYKQSFYLTHHCLQVGKNIISLRRACHVETEVLVKSAAVMRFEIEKQKRSEWCWAAITTSLLKFFTPESEITQCEVVRHCFNKTKGFETTKDCCKNSKTDECNRQFKLIDALDFMGVLSMRCNYPLSLDEIREQINQGVPVAIRIKWNGGGAHFVMITAVGPPDPRGDDFTWLRVSDPNEPTALYKSYKILKKDKRGEWSHSYLFEKERKRHS